MQDIVYAAADGLRVTLPARTWEHHIRPYHPEVTLAAIELALTHPARICDHRQFPAQQIYEGPAVLGARSFPVVVVERRGTGAGVVVTARVSRRHYRGVQRWP